MRNIIGSLLRGRSGDRDIGAEMESEMRAHIELEAEELVRGGMDPASAHRHAAARFGGVAQTIEAANDQSSLPLLGDVWRSIRVATRMIRRSPTFSLTTIIALGLAIGVTTTVFSLLDAVVNPPMSVPHPDRLFVVKFVGSAPGGRMDWTLPGRLLDLPNASVASHAGSTFYAGNSTVEVGSTIRHARGITVSPSFFTTLEVPPLEGRLVPSSDPVDAMQTVVINDRLRRELFPGEGSAVGRVMLVEGQPKTIIGVVHSDPSIAALGNDLWLFPSPGQFIRPVFIRLKQGISTEQAKRELATLSRRVVSGLGYSSADAIFLLSPAASPFRARGFHFALLGAGLAVLLIACANLANLQLARGIGRSGEIAVQAALGATRRHIVLQLMAENGVLAVGGMLLAVCLTIGGNAILRATIPQSLGGYIIAPQTNWRMVGFAAGATLLSLLLVGLWPSLRASRVDLNALLKARAGSGAHRYNARWYGALVIAQIALTMPLAVAATVLSLSAWNSARMATVLSFFGYDPTSIVVADFVWPRPDSGATLPVSGVAAALMGTTRRVPGVAATTIVLTAAPRHAMVTVADAIGGFREVPAPSWTYRIVSPTYFDVFARVMSKGTGFEPGTADGSVVLDEHTAQTLWPNESPIGKMIKMGDARSDEPWHRVRGVLGSQFDPVTQARMREAGVMRLTELFMVLTPGDSVSIGPYKRYEFPLYARANGDPQRVASQLRRAFVSSTPVAPKVQLMFESLGIPQTIETTRFVSRLFLIFGGVALGLAGLGVYGIIAQSVADRRREVAIRVALGATTRQIVHALLRERNVVLLAGIAIGLPLTIATQGEIAAFLAWMPPSAIWAHAAVCAGLFLFFVGIAMVPAWRAAAAAPMDVLRAE